MIMIFSFPFVGCSRGVSPASLHRNLAWKPPYTSNPKKCYSSQITTWQLPKQYSTKNSLTYMEINMTIMATTSKFLLWKGSGKIYIFVPIWQTKMGLNLLNEFLNGINFSDFKRIKIIFIIWKKLLISAIRFLRPQKAKKLMINVSAWLEFGRP